MRRTNRVPPVDRCPDTNCAFSTTTADLSLRLIDRRRSEDFQFVFLGSGPGSWRTGQRMGFNFSVATDWNDPRNSENIYKSLYTVSNTVSTGGTISVDMLSTPSTTAKRSND